MSWWLLLALLALPGVASAHGFRPGRLDLRERDAGRYEVSLKIPRGGEAGEDGLEPLRLVLPPRCVREGEVTRVELGLSVVERYRVRCGPEGLGGATVRFEGLDDRGTDMLVRFVRRGGASRTVVVRPDAPWVALPGGPGERWRTARSYLGLGVEHLLTGADHLLFLLGLLWLVDGLRALVKTVTAFTVGHSITLALASLGLLRLRPEPVEACIALSIVLLAVELSRPRDSPPTLTRRAPWLVAGGFGLVHGLGFAGALREVGLPEAELPLALVSFNVGLELAQVAMVLLATALGAVVAKRAPKVVAPSRLLAVYALGAVACFWCLERTGRLVG
ncbi:MAG: HupE/UreJ family protein [Deltaproteobacteria bacterium]|nr:HupE/UreJ family protein [Deltaproteobacteria bacterium]